MVAQEGSAEAMADERSNALAFLYTQAGDAEGSWGRDCELHGGIYWFEPYHLDASDADMTTLEHVLLSITGRNAYLKPETPPPFLIVLLSRMSARSAKERRLIAWVLRLYPDHIKVKELGHLTGPAHKKELKNPKGLPSDRLFQLNSAIQALSAEFTRDQARKNTHRKERQVVVDRFQNSFMEARVQAQASKRADKHIAEARAALTSDKRVEEATLLARYDAIGSEIEGQRTFMRMWRQRDGALSETFGGTEAVWLRHRRMQLSRRPEDAEQKAAEVERSALAYAEAKLREGKDLVFDDREFQQKLDESVVAKGPKAFTFRDVPSWQDGCLPFHEMRRKNVELYRRRVASAGGGRRRLDLNNTI